MAEHYNIIGLMSGTSLDGLDIAFCEFELNDGKWSFDILKTCTSPYSTYWKNKLSSAMNFSADQLTDLDMEYGNHTGNLVNQFIEKHNLKPAYIASHGHTIFHRPDLGYTYQLGSGASIAATTGINTICNFRAQDVALGGQGAPLVPIGDKLLFSEYDFCLNLGGFANVSYENNGKRIAFDICPVNIALNFLAIKAGKDYDKDGLGATSGKIILAMLEQLNSLEFYTLDPPKSLGKEWLETNFIPILKNNFGHSVNDMLCTVCEHIAMVIAKSIKRAPQSKTLVTGGGAYNHYLIDRIKSVANINLIIPDDTIIQYKEAMIFAFLGVLRLRSDINCLSSVTGASSDHCSGAIY